MRLILLALLNSLCFVSLAQTTFIEDTQNVFTGIGSGESIFGDVDGDGDLDIFITGYAENFTSHAKLYLNDGTGLFTESANTIPKFGYSSAAFADVDNDNDLDLLISGQGGDFFIPGGAFLYLNDGSGNFTNAYQPLAAVMHSKVGFADIDNDGDQDILIMGLDIGFSGSSTTMYINDGSGNYTLSTNELISAYQGDFDFADIDDDGDLDVLITGSTANGFENATTLYKNDGTGNFEIVEDTPFEDVNISSVDFADIDGDLDQDVLITGSSDYVRTTSLYTNNGLGEFKLKENTGIVDVIFGDCSLSDFDLDGDIDILIIGRKGAIPDETGKLYINDGNGNFSEDHTSNFTGATGGTVDVGDVDGDGDLDAFIIGLSPDETVHSKLYINDLTLGTESSSLVFQLEVFPNPCTDFLMLQSEENLDDVTIELYNSKGQSLRSNKYQRDNQVEIPVQSLSSGIYFLRVSDVLNRSRTISFIKE